MTSLNIVPTSRPRHRRSPDVSALVADLRRQHGKQASNVLFEMLSEDETLMRAVAVFVVEKLAAATPRRRVMPSAKERHQIGEKERETVRKVAERIRAVVLLDLIMPNRVAMRFNTGTQMAAFGSAYEKIAERVGAAMVGEVMVEAEVRALLNA